MGFVPLDTIQALGEWAKLFHAWLVAKIQFLGLIKAKTTTWEKALWALEFMGRYAEFDMRNLDQSA